MYLTHVLRIASFFVCLLAYSLFMFSYLLACLFASLFVCVSALPASLLHCFVLCSCFFFSVLLCSFFVRFKTLHVSKQNMHPNFLNEY